MSDKVKGPAHIFLESERKDHCFDKFFDEDNTRFMRPGGKDNVISCISALEERMKDKTKKNYFGIVDQDFDSVLFQDYIGSYPRNLFLTDTHDQETMVFASGALEEYLLARANQGKLASFEKRVGKSIREVVLDSAVTIGCSTCIALENLNYGRSAIKRERMPDLSFLKTADRFGKYFEDYLIIDTLEINLEEFCEDFNELNYGYFPIDKWQIIGKKEQLDSDLRWEMANGHHMSNILAVGLKNLFGVEGYKNEFDQPKIIEKEMARLYNLKLFSRTKLCRSIRTWETTNLKPVFSEAADKQVAYST
jgi:hypothetical protein